MGNRRQVYVLLSMFFRQHKVNTWRNFHFCFVIYIKNFIFQNTYTNAEKLLAAAEELARSGECDPEEVLSVARELEAHVAAFAARVDRRRRRLDLAVLLYTHEKEVGFIELQVWNG